MYNASNTSKMLILIKLTDYLLNIVKGKLLFMENKIELSFKICPYQQLT